MTDELPAPIEAEALPSAPEEPQVAPRLDSPQAIALRRELMKRLKMSDSVNGHLKAISELARPADSLLVQIGRDYSDIIPENLLLHVPIDDPQQLLAWWQERFREAKMNFADAEWYRFVIAWRITREIARLQKIVAEDETLAEALTNRKDPRDVWANYVGKTPKIDEPTASINILTMIMFRSNLGLAMPDVPLAFIDKEGFVLPGYDPKYDARLQAWNDLILMIAERLSLFAGSVQYPELGQMGLKSITEPHLQRILWPSRYELLRFEGHLVHETLEELQKSGGPRAARKALKNRYNFNQEEVAALIAAASREAAFQNGTEDVAQAKALLVLRFEELIERCKESADVRAELMALRALAGIQGVTRMDPDDSSTAFVEAITKVASERKTKPLALGKPKP